MTRRQPRGGFALTSPGGPPGWPGAPGGLSLADAAHVLGRGTRLPVYVFAVDQAHRSGWAAHDLRRVVRQGATTNTPQAVDALESLRTLPGFDWERVLVVFEDHRGINNRQKWTDDGKPLRNPVDIAIGLGDARGGWRVLLDLRNHPKAQRVLVAPSEWRRVIAGARFGVGDDWKSAALRWASAQGQGVIDDDNAAEAMVMSQWGAIDGLFAWATKRLEERLP